ncbi:AAA family ATPase [Bradyrhizobium sp. LMG 9283]|uniref:AAA family ATPase n=1 Tax=Bradyrhizobium sp. LMG 9283 TaxID=592064 RepID=UPI00388E5ED5
MTAAQPKSVLDMILEWSLDRPLWQRDALRRIVANGKLLPEDLAELVQLCLKGRGARDIELSATPLAAEHVPAVAAAEAAISLTSIADVAGVNRLASGQTLSFEPTGITVIYGDNGVGKSGYARILKRACRARFVGDLLPNAFDPSATQTASATIAYAAGNVAAPAIPWVNDGKPHPILSAVWVFDRDSGAVHVRSENEVAFRPFGLDIPDELAGVCQAVKEALAAEQGKLEAARDAVFIKPIFSTTSPVGNILSSLTPATDLAALEALAPISEAEEGRLVRLNEDLARDPLKAAGEERALALSLHRFADDLANALAGATDEVLSNLLALAEDARQKRGAATFAAEAAFGSAPIKGVGGAAWRTLWEAARRYSEQVAYPEGPFPPAAGDAICVLCHQTLPEEAATRMSSFERFVKADTEKLAQEAERNFEKARLALASKPVRIAAFPLRRQLAIRAPSVAAAVLRSLAAARLRRFICLSSLNQPGTVQMPNLPADPVPLTRQLAEDTARYAEELAAAADLAGRKRLEDERDALRDRKALDVLLPKARAEVTRLAQLDRIAKCLTETGTRAITTLGNNIADYVITPRVRDRFQEEIQKLAASRVRVDIVRSGGKYGSPQYQIRLFANETAKVHSVLSEGEQTCVALAVFLTELATAAHASCLVFDDPVSSLDHRWRQKVAERLVEEAGVRQIVVFTHDLVFLNDLQTLAHKSGVALKEISLTQSGLGAGIVNNGLPWAGQKVKERLDNLEKEARAAARYYEAHDDEAYNAAVVTFYNRLRSTWERALEDVAFCNVVNRHRDYINARDLKKVTALTEADATAWAAGFKTCCDITDAHDPSRGRNAASPPPADLLKHIRDLSTWVTNLRERQKQLQ